uniref:Cytoplasmic dynein 2 light intermediate chain 1 n=1 Tax=Romanomermis culicivorax TaxID=13658 RepID=A0A915HD82_ROMCU
MSIWDMAREKLKEVAKVKEESFDPANSYSQDETHIVIFGSKGCGKTSLILRFLEKDEQARATIGLEYMYGRRSKGNGKEVGHIWELAGNLSNANLLAIPINERNIGCFNRIDV